VNSRFRVDALSLKFSLVLSRSNISCGLRLHQSPEFMTPLPELPPLSPTDPRFAPVIVPLCYLGPSANTGAP